MVLPKDPNPYQELLHDALRAEGVEPAYLPMPTPSRSLNLLLVPVQLLVARLRGVRLLHVHWVFGLTLTGAERSPLLRRVSQWWFGVLLATCRVLGVRVVWTAHNVLPHQQVFDDDRAARRALLRATSHVLVHDAHVTAELAALAAPAPLPPTTVVPHGSYVGHYPPRSPRAEARRRLGLPDDARLLLFVGRVTVEKGVDDLLEAFSRTDSDVVLVVAGLCPDPALAERLHHAAAADPRLRLDLRHLADDVLADHLSAADAVVLPFRRVTTSGSVLLAMAFAVPVVVPGVPQLAGLPDAACTRFAPGVAGLEAALRAVADAPSDALQRAGRAGLEWTRGAT
ncbi:glycosyltransferase, partial [Angustibacter aerolatus]